MDSKWYVLFAIGITIHTQSIQPITLQVPIQFLSQFFSILDRFNQFDWTIWEYDQRLFTNRWDELY